MGLPAASFSKMKIPNFIKTRMPITWTYMRGRGWGYGMIFIHEQTREASESVSNAQEQPILQFHYTG